ncbi:MAG: lipoprotein [Bacteroidetes bacterium]|nr:MAG: lipoprotein [Bacteroidota bacterium]
MTRKPLFFFAFLLLLSCRPLPQLAEDHKHSPYINYPCIFVSPEKDAKNPVEILFVKTDTLDNSIRKEISVVFVDEDLPFFFFDWCYDAYRRNHYRRKKDIESFVLYYSAATDALDSVAFPSTFSRDQRFRKNMVTHFSQTFPGSAFRLTDSRPVIFVNTWNHMFSPVDENPGMKKDSLFAGWLRKGSRADAESYFRRK